MGVCGIGFECICWMGQSYPDQVKLKKENYIFEDKTNNSLVETPRYPWLKFDPLRSHEDQL